MYIIQRLNFILLVIIGRLIFVNSFVAIMIYNFESARNRADVARAKAELIVHEIQVKKQKTKKIEDVNHREKNTEVVRSNKKHEVNIVNLNRQKSKGGGIGGDGSALVTEI